MSKNNYGVGDWHGRPNYECELCAFATLDEALMREHQRVRHAVFPDAPTPANPRPESAPSVGRIDHPTPAVVRAEPPAPTQEEPAPAAKPITPQETE